MNDQADDPKDDDAGRSLAPSRTAKRIIAGVVVLGLIGLYVNGNFDRLLYGVGLNFHECRRNGLGATFCGKELDEYRTRISGAEEKVRNSLATSQREAKEQQATTERETTERQRTEHEQQASQLEAKMAREKHIVETETAGSYAYDLARDEYEAARGELQQLRVAEGG